MSAQLGANQTDVLAVLRYMNRPLRVSMLRTLLDLGPKDLDSTLRLLARRGLVQRVRWGWWTAL